MASLTAPGPARLSRPQAKITAGTISSLRIRPFTRILGAPRKLVLLRAAEPEAPGAVVEEEFSFSLSDARKGNEYNASDVEAAMRFYAGDGDAPGEVNSEFVENVFGTEDASYFDDMDNNEAYEDEFTAAGIPEAAPKQRQGRRGGEEKEDGVDSDDIAAAKAASEFNTREEDMVLSSEMEEFGLDQEKKSNTRVVGPAVWNWMQDVDVDAGDDEQLTLLSSASNRIMDADVAAALPTDEEVFADLRNANLQDVDVETRDTIEFLLDDFDIENELKAVPDDIEDVFTMPETTVLSEEDVSRIDALLAEDLGLPDMDLEGLADLEEIEDDGLEMSDAAVDAYVASLKASEGAALTEEQIKEMFADEPLQVVDASADPEVTMDDVDLTEPVFEQIAEADYRVEAIEDALFDTADMELSELRAELLALRNMGDVEELTVPEEELEVLEQYLNASQQFIEMEDVRKADLAAAVLRGELPVDVLEDEEEAFVDVETELLMPDDEVEGADEADADFEDDENWQERIIELNRVTKVVKGGKLMGFRCTAIVGNNNGLVGVGCQAGREISTAVKRALVDAKKNVVRVPLVGAGTVPHRVEAKFNAARCVVLPAADGTGVLAGGSIRSVLELAGVKNVLAKRIGCRSLLNNARCAVAALEQLRTLQDVSAARGVPMERLLLPK